MNEILADSRKNTKVKIIQSEDIRIPMISGFFNPVIYLPAMQFSDEELKNILLHEWTHFLHKDAWVKLSIYLISSIFWWNPFVHILRHELNCILEIQCDLSITSQMDEKTRINYLEGILKVIRASEQNTFPNAVPIDCAALVSTNKAKKIEQRFKLVLDYDSGKKKRILPMLLLCTMILLFFVASYRFVIQPRTYSTVKVGYEDTFTITPENSYLSINKNGTYSLYSDGKYRCDISEIDKEPFSSLPIK
jgi:beta-lactamase regulating signal transducer with metallopeptidase domain